MAAEFKSFKYRIYPNSKQKEILELYFRLNREAYNYFLNLCLQSLDVNGILLNYDNLIPYIEEFLKNYPVIDLNKTSIAYTIHEVIKNVSFYKRKISRRPKPKDEHNHFYSFKIKNFNRSITIGDRIDISVINGIKYRSSLKLSGNILNATVSKTPINEYYITFLAKYPYINNYKKTGKSIGVDAGEMNLATLSDYTVYENKEEYLKLIARISFEKKKLEKMTYGSKRYEKQRIKLAKLYNKMKNRRLDNLHKMTTDIVKKYDNIYVETLNIIYMVKKSKTPQKILDASWAEAQRMLEYKCKWYGKKLYKIRPEFKSSQICSKCGYVYYLARDYSLKEWMCPNCKTIHNRDTNAAINILEEGNK